MGTLYRWLLAGVLLAISLTASAETIPATPTAKLCPATQQHKFVADGQEVCNSMAFCTALGVGLWSGGSNFVVCNTQPTRTTIYYTTVPDVAGYICPAGQNWTLSGSTCTRPDCVAPQTRDPSTGQCSNPCQAKIDQGTKYGIYEHPKNASIAGQYCDGGCRLGIGVTTQPYLTNGNTVVKVYSQTYLADSQCQAGDRTPPGTYGNNAMPDNHKPACQPGEGVMTSSIGNVRCVPSGTPSANTPKVNDSTKTETYPDGSTKTTDKKTTTDPGTGATHTGETTTNTPGPSGGTQSGTPGTSTNDGDSTTDKGSDNETDKFCDQKPDSIICKNSTFSGECGTGGNGGFTCEGDAALCAAAKAANELKCAATDETGTATQTGKKLIDGQDDMQNLPDPNSPQNFNLGGLSYADVGGSCPPDLNFVVMGRTSTVSMAEACNIGGWLGSIGVALSLLVAGFIVVGAIRNS